MIKWPERFPPSIIAAVFLCIGAVVGYFYAQQSIGRDLAEANLNTVVDGEKEASKIRIERDRDLEKVWEFKEQVKDGKIKISNGNHVNSVIVDDWLQQLEQARP